MKLLMWVKCISVFYYEFPYERHMKVRQILSITVITGVFAVSVLIVRSVIHFKHYVIFAFNFWESNMVLKQTYFTQ